MDDYNGRLKNIYLVVSRFSISFCRREARHLFHSGLFSCVTVYFSKVQETSYVSVVSFSDGRC